jgi:hypothetical protein
LLQGRGNPAMKGGQTNQEERMRMNGKRWMVPAAALVLAACGGGGDEEGGAAPETTTPPPGSEAPLPQPTDTGQVDTAGMGVNPPTAGGQIVDTAAVPGPTDTTQGTATAP